MSAVECPAERAFTESLNDRSVLARGASASWGEEAQDVDVLLERRWHRGTALAVHDEYAAVSGMATLTQGCPRYAG